MEDAPVPPPRLVLRCEHGKEANVMMQCNQILVD
jgi:hypothetical protein